MGLLSVLCLVTFRLQWNPIQALKGGRTSAQKYSFQVSDAYSACFSIRKRIDIYAEIKDFRVYLLSLCCSRLFPFGLIREKVLLFLASSLASSYLCVRKSYIMTNSHIDSLDQKILSMIADNARVPFLEVARACNVSGAAIHQRIQKLTQQGVIKGSQFIFDPETLGYETCAFVGLYLKDPSDFDRVVEALRAIPEVVECHYTTGGYDMFIKIYARNNHHMLSIIHDKLQPLGLQRSETIISFHEAIKRQFPVPNNPVDE